MTFEQLKLTPPLLRALREKGYTRPTPIQQKAIPPALEGADVLGCAQTGTGKTAAFALPILQRLWTAPGTKHAAHAVRALILCPTRELATQIGESFATYGKHSGLRCTVVFGGVGYPRQRETLRRGVDIVVATPGRLLDLMGEGTLRFDALEVLVLDEADRMLDMGFLPDVKRILAKLPKHRQTMCFSATMPPPIRELTARILHKPVEVAVTPVASTVEKVVQSVFMVDGQQKGDLLAHLLQDPNVTRALVFTRTKRGADRVAKRLVQSGLSAEAIHGNKSQNARERALHGFKSGKGLVLVATDIAARGIDVTGISHVINYELPNEPETYVHRIGRTARAEASGVAWAFCSREERDYLRDIERLIKLKIEVNEHPFISTHRGHERVASSSRGAPAHSRPHAPARPRAHSGSHSSSNSAPRTPRAGHAGPLVRQLERAPRTHAAQPARPFGEGAREAHAAPPPRRAHPAAHTSRPAPARVESRPHPGPRRDGHGPRPGR